MKRIISTALALIIMLSFVSCKSKNNTATNDEPTTTPKNEYILSDEVEDGSVIDGVMTDIESDDSILKKTTASWLDTAVIYEVNVRQYTDEGTFKAFSQSLQRLKDTGVNTLWFMPIHPISKTERKGTLGSYYSVDDYLDVNPEFGTLDDFKELVKKAHDMGFKVALDWVANHTGWDNKWITEHEDWYVHKKNGEIESPYDWSDTAQLDYTNYELRAQMIKCMQFWVEDIGVDGFRCDHAVGVPGTFWNAAVYKLKSINSELLFLAEASPAQSLTNYAFDSCYNDSFYSSTMSIKNGISPESLQLPMKKSTNYSGNSFAMNYLDNHDKNAYNNTVVTAYGDSYPDMLCVLYTMPGMPMLYTSNEDGYDHNIEFFEKDAVKWSEHKYQQLLSSLSKIKSENKSLYSANGGEIEFLDTDSFNVLAYTRKKDGNCVTVVVNLSGDVQKNTKINAQLDDSSLCVLHGKDNEFEMPNKAYSATDMDIQNLQAWETYIFTSQSN